MIMDMQVSPPLPEKLALKVTHRLSDEQGDQMSKTLTEVCKYSRLIRDDRGYNTLQTFRGRLTEIIDQAQHFAALGPSGGGGSIDDTTQSFREGLDGTERECELQADAPCPRTNASLQYLLWRRRAQNERNGGMKAMIELVVEVV